MIRWLRRLWWELQDRRIRGQTERVAFAAGRFVLYLFVQGRANPRVLFTPLEEEAPAFFREYVAPWLVGDPRPVFSLTGPWQNPGAPVSDRAPYLEVLRHRDIYTVEIQAPDAAYRDRLGEILREVHREALGRAEAERTAHQAAGYIQQLAAAKDAYRAMMGGGKEKGGGG